MWRQMLLLLSIVILFDAFKAHNTSNRKLINLFRELYRNNKERHEKMRRDMIYNHIDVLTSLWVFQSQYPEDRVLSGVEGYMKEFSKQVAKNEMARDYHEKLISDLEDTEVMQKLEQFLGTSGNFLGTDFMLQWFRADSNSISLFERVFLSEEKYNNAIQINGYRPYIAYDEETMNKQLLNMRGIIKQIPVAPDVKIVKVQENPTKPPKTFIIGLSVELEMAMYTACFALHPNQACEVALDNTKFKIYTSGSNSIEDAYPIL